MNILYLTNHLDIGGITSYVLSLAGGLKLRGHNIYIASSSEGQLLKLMSEGINFIPIPIRTKSEVSPKIIISLFKLAKVIRKNNIDIVHANSRTTQVLGCLLEKKTAVASISTCHGFFKKRFSRRLFPCWGRPVIAISQQVKEHLINDFKVRNEDIRLIHNGIDAGNLREESSGRRAQIKKELGLGDGPVVGIVARLSDVKGHIYLIQAMSPVLEKFPSAKLLIVGEGPMEDKLKAKVLELKIGKSVVFLPSVSDTGEVLEAMDLFVMPSLKEGLGLSLMEAMAKGRAVIGSNVGGIKTLIQHKFNGLLVNPEDEQGLSLAILELLQDPIEAKSLGNNARGFIAQNFSLEEMLLKTEEAYRECVNKN